MPIVRQVAELYLRGSLANVTMKNLTEGEQECVSATVDYVASHPKMAKHRAGFMEELRKTIGADYSDDRRTAEAEFRTAVWKASVELLYHRKYKFQCEACGSRTGLTQDGRIKKIDRQEIPCPNCKKVFVTDAGDTNLKRTTSKWSHTYVDHDEFQNSYLYFNPLKRAPECRSAIKYIAGKKKYTDAQAQGILADPLQLVKFFGEFVWNYFRQQINENKRKEHKRKEKIRDRADRVIVQEIISLCGKHKIDFNYCKESNPNDGLFIVNVVGLLTPPEFTHDFTVLRERAAVNDIAVSCIANGIQVLENPAAGELTATISKSEHVLVLENTTGGEEVEGGGYTISQLCFRTVGAERMDQDDHVQEITTTDLMRAVRKSLPMGECQQIFDIQSGTGTIYSDFSAKFGDKRPRKNHIAKFLGITPRLVTQHIADIKVQCLVHGLVPQS